MINLSADLVYTCCTDNPVSEILIGEFQALTFHITHLLCCGAGRLFKLLSTVRSLSPPLLPIEEETVKRTPSKLSLASYPRGPVVIVVACKCRKSRSAEDDPLLDPDPVGSVSFSHVLLFGPLPECQSSYRCSGTAKLGISPAIYDFCKHIGDGEDSGEDEGCCILSLSVPAEDYAGAVEGFHLQDPSQGHRELDQRISPPHSSRWNLFVRPVVPGEGKAGTQILNFAISPLLGGSHLSSACKNCSII